MGGCLSVLFCLMTYSSLLNNMNFSKVGGVLIGVGMAIFSYCIRDQYRNKDIFFLDWWRHDTCWKYGKKYMYKKQHFHLYYF